MKKTAEQTALLAERRARAAKVLEVLEQLYPNPRPHLAASDAWELLVATVLAAQCTDARVNQVTPGLFRRLPDVRSFTEISQVELEEIIRSTGFYRNKAKHLIAAARKLVERFDGQVPDNMEDLLTLDGVARKTANVVLWGAFGKNEGLAVDTHVARISRRLDLSGAANPEGVERDLCAVLPQPEWGNYNHRMVSFGREACDARTPRCPACPMLPFCPQLELKTKDKAGLKANFKGLQTARPAAKAGKEGKTSNAPEKTLKKASEKTLSQASTKSRRGF